MTARSNETMTARSDDYRESVLSLSAAVCDEASDDAAADIASALSTALRGCRVADAMLALAAVIVSTLFEAQDASPGGAPPELACVALAELALRGIKARNAAKGAGVK